MKLSFVILNEVKNLKSVSVCIQILRVAQDDKTKNFGSPPRPLPLGWSNQQIPVRKVVPVVY